MTIDSLTRQLVRNDPLLAAEMICAAVANSPEGYKLKIAKAILACIDERDTAREIVDYLAADHDLNTSIWDE